MSSSTRGFKRGAEDAGEDAVASKRLRRTGSNNTKKKPPLVDLYMAGQTQQYADGEKRFMMILQQKPIKDVSWMRSNDRSESGKSAYILYQDGKLHRWGPDQVHWSDASHYDRKISNTPFLSQVAQVTCSAGFAGAIKRDGSVWTWGQNQHGQLGRPDLPLDQDHGPGPVKELASLTVKRIACTSHAMIVLDDKGKLYSWGGHKHSQTGQGETEGFSAQPANLEGLPPMKEISACKTTALALTNDGKIYSWGGMKNIFHDPITWSSRPALFQREFFSGEHVVQICRGQKCNGAVTRDGKVFIWEQYSDKLPSKIKEFDDHPIGKIAIGARHAVAVSADGNSVFVWGCSFYGQLGLGKSPNDDIRRPTLLSQPLHGKITKCIATGNFTALLVDPRFEKRLAAASLFHLPHLFNNPETYPDIEFTSSDGDVVCYAHKSILCSKSSYFEGLFQSEMQEANRKQLQIVHCSTEVFLKVMKFLYEVEIYQVKAEKLPELYQAADIYLLEDLKTWCREVLVEGLSLQNAGTVLQDLFSRGQEELVAVCLEFLHKNRAEWIEENQFTQQITSNELWKRIYKFSFVRENLSP